MVRKTFGWGEIGDRVSFKNPETGKYDENDPNCHGIVVSSDLGNETIRVSNTHEDFLGTFTSELINWSDVI